MKRSWRVRRAVATVSTLFLVCLQLAVGLAGRAQAITGTTFTVTTTDDHADGTCGADCSLRDAVIAANATGGGVRVTAAELTLSNDIVRFNFATGGDGGGVYNDGGELTLDNTSVDHNFANDCECDAGRGGGVYASNDHGTPTTTVQNGSSI